MHEGTSDCINLVLILQPGLGCTTAGTNPERLTLQCSCQQSLLVEPAFLSISRIRALSSQPASAGQLTSISTSPLFCFSAIQEAQEIWVVRLRVFRLRQRVRLPSLEHTKRIFQVHQTGCQHMPRAKGHVASSSGCQAVYSHGDYTAMSEPLSFRHELLQRP